MGIRTGSDYLSGLRNHPREVWLKGKRVDDVTSHPAFARPLAHTAALFDMQHDPQFQDRLTFIADSGERVSVAHLPCYTPDDLKRRGDAYRIVAETSLGMMGRSPDFLGSVIFGFGESAELLSSLGPQFVQNLRAYANKVRDEDLFLTHAIITPQVDRSKSSGEQADPYIHLGIVRETNEGLIVRGARMLATMGPISDEVLVYSMANQKQEDKNYVLVFALPLDTPGIRQICREPYDHGDRVLGDHPMGANFEDSDTLIIFDDVLVPWDRVFAYNDIETINQFHQKNSGRNHSSYQAAVRGMVKLEFVIGLITEVVKANGADKFLHVQQMVGECIHYLELMKSCLSRAVNEPEVSFNGTVRPQMAAVTTGRMLTARFYSRVVEILQIVGAGGMQMMPSIEDFNSPIDADIRKYYRGAAETDAETRIRLFKLAWDICGDAFGQRQVQYERYHLGDPVRNLANMFLNFDKSRGKELVNKALDAGMHDILDKYQSPINRVA